MIGLMLLTIVIPMVFAATLKHRQQNFDPITSILTFLYDVFSSFFHPIKLYYQLVAAKCLRQKLLDKNDMSFSNGMLMERRNIKKSLSNTWKHFSCQIHLRIANTCKKLNSHNGFWSYLQHSTANPAHLAALFLPCLALPSKGNHGNQFFCLFLESAHQ